MIQTIPRKIHILGEGVTAKAVRQTLPFFDAEEVGVNKAEMIVASPGIPPKDYPKTTVEIVSEIELAYRLLKKKYADIPIVAITGTNGKTTVTSLLAHLLDVPPFGNIGTPLITVLQSKKMVQKIVVEVSSYQLDQSPTFSPDIAIYLNLTPDHLDRHGSMQCYIEAKNKIFNRQTSRDCLMVSRQVCKVCPEVKRAQSEVIIVEPESPWLEMIDTELFLGRHNHENACFALRAAEKLGVTASFLKERLNTYQFYPHRLEPIGKLNGMLCINDSKATNPESTIAAITTFQSPIHLILAGFDKGLDWQVIRDEIRQSTVVSVWVIGAIRGRFFSTLPKDENESLYHDVESLELAVKRIQNIGREGDILLFSPACSSFDLYQNFEERGEVFRQIILSQNRYQK